MVLVLPGLYVFLQWPKHACCGAFFLLINEVLQKVLHAHISGANHTPLFRFPEGICLRAACLLEFESLVIIFHTLALKILFRKHGGNYVDG